MHQTLHSYFSILIILIYFTSADSIIVKSSFGDLNGYQGTARNGNKVNVFKKVPFAQPPIGKLRFEKPIPPKKWEGVRDATQYSAACMSNSTTTSSPQKQISEDCLYLNIFAGAKCTSISPCPVIVYLHGGDLTSDSAVMFDDQHMIDRFGGEDTILVLPAFRLGIFSHLTFAVDVIPNNLAFYDILLGLEFVQREIANFGGNPKSVTLMGHSSGGATALYFTFSKNINSDGRLFQKVIALSPLLYFHEVPSMIRLSWDFAEQLKCGTYNKKLSTNEDYINRVVKCMKGVPAADLLAVQRKNEDLYTDQPQVLPGEFMRIPPFAPEESLEEFIRAPKPMPMMIGATSREMDTRNIQPTQMEVIIPFKNQKEVIKKYSNDLKNPNRNFEHSVESNECYITEYQYAHAMRAAGGKTYLYSYDNPTRPYHTDDMCYLLGVHCKPLTEDEQQIDIIYPKLVTNFAKTGVPHPDWKPLEKGKDNYFSIDYDTKTKKGPIMKNNFQNATINYWFKEMKVFDQSVTEWKQRVKSKIDLKEGDISPIEVMEAATIRKKSWVEYAISTYVVLIVFVLGCVIGAWFQWNHFINKNQEDRPLVR